MGNMKMVAFKLKFSLCPPAFEVKFKKKAPEEKKLEAESESKKDKAKS